MAATGTPSLSAGSSYGPVRAFGLGSVTLAFATVTVGATYATGGQPVTLPGEIAGRTLAAITVLNPHDGTRLWVWNGSTSAPTLMAYDAFATQEGNATDTSAVTVRYLMFVFTD